MRIGRALSTSFIGGLVATAVGAVPLQEFASITPQRGLADGGNKYGWSALAPSFDDRLYVGTFNVNFDYPRLPTYLRQIENAPQPGLAGLQAFSRLWSGSPVTPSTGGQIWRTDGETWEKVFQAGPEDVGFRKMVEFDGAIYAGTANGPDGPDRGDEAYVVLPGGGASPTVTYAPDGGTSLFRSADGTTWTEVPGGPASSPLNVSNRAMAVVGDRLFVGTENPGLGTPLSGPELWSLGDDGWRLEAKLREGLAIGEIAAVGEEVVVGTSASGDQGLQLLHLTPNATPSPFDNLADITPVVPTTGPGDDTLGVMELRSFGDQFYLGTLGYAGGFTLLRTVDPLTADPATGWQQITGSGFSEFPGGTSANAYPWSSAVFGEHYYLGTFQLTGTGPFDGLADPFLFGGRAQLWRSADGLDWELVEDNGFDSLFTYGIRELVVWNETLAAVTASNLFVPDLFSAPYLHLASFGQGDLAGWLLAAIADGLLPTAAVDKFAALHEKLPYVGFEVYLARPVPLPAPALLLTAAMAGLFMAGRRRA